MIKAKKPCGEQSYLARGDNLNDYSIIITYKIILSIV